MNLVMVILSSVTMDIIISYIKLTIIIQCYENTSITTICRMIFLHTPIKVFISFLI